MHQFMKHTLAAAVLFLSMFTALAFSYAITPNDNKSISFKNDIKINIKIENKLNNYKLSHSINLLIPKVKS